MGIDFGLAPEPWEELFTDDLSTVTDIAAVNGTWALSSGVLRATGAAYIYAVHTEVVHRPIVLLEVEVRVPAAATGEVYAGPTGRWNGTDINTTPGQLSVFLARTSTTAGNPFTHMRIARGGAASQTVALPSTVPVDTWAKVGALLTHAGAVGFVNGVAVMTMVEPPIGGKLGHRIGLGGGAASLGPEFRNLRVAALPLPRLEAA